MEHPARKDFLEGTFTLGDDTRIAKKAYLDSREVAPLLRAVARVTEDAAGAEVDEASAGGDVEIVEVVEDLGCCSPQPVSIDRSPESTAGDVEIVGEVLVLGLLGSQQPVSIDRSSSEASSISLLEAEEETLQK